MIREHQDGANFVRVETQHGLITAGETDKNTRDITVSVHSGTVSVVTLQLVLRRLWLLSSILLPLVFL